VREKYRASEAVFVGEVVAVSGDAEKRTMAIKFKVEEYWKGVTYPDMIVVSPLPKADSCGLAVEVGGKYLVYAWRDGQLQTSVCSSLSLEHAADELKKLGKGKPYKAKS